ncbi:MAG: hypothetical protein ABSA32_11775 [Candidatus Acidiferrales bacterium]|jgi:uncharacterized protein YndB with AHSA1/START domain
MTISDTAVEAATGKTWAKWCALFDKAGAAKWDHRAIVLHLRKSGLPSWWSQMVTVGYERARGRRVVHQTTTGFSISASKTIDLPVGRVFAAWASAPARRQWLRGVKLEVRAATRNKSIRAGWENGKASVVVMFYAKGKAKTQTAVEHSRLASAKEAARMQAYWSANLERLKALLESKA